ncbi:hypothetical protein L596_006967 [Steinernema carpocapsae]|uniref:Uncharacterized protein n=1 Tax=Steinernema carpocapsae TaxID=34508 RepID=A0A4U5P8J1_STECR|nr:hypothetical protein L596_006967 [Steinernema carpocapsae]
MRAVQLQPKRCFQNAREKTKFASLINIPLTTLKSGALFTAATGGHPGGRRGGETGRDVASQERRNQVNPSRGLCPLPVTRVDRSPRSRRSLNRFNSEKETRRRGPVPGKGNLDSFPFPDQTSHAARSPREARA